MSLNQKLLKVYTALNTIEGAKIYHYEKPASVKAPYVVWMEDSTDSFGADNRMAEYRVHGTIDVYSKIEFDSLFDNVMSALNGICAVQLNSVQYEDDTKLIHYEYEFWVA